MVLEQLSLKLLIPLQNENFAFKGNSRCFFLLTGSYHLPFCATFSDLDVSRDSQSLHKIKPVMADSLVNVSAECD